MGPAGSRSRIGIRSSRLRPWQGAGGRCLSASVCWTVEMVVSAGSPWGGVQAGLRVSQGGYECCGISGPGWRGINMLLQFSRGTPGAFKAPCAASQDWSKKPPQPPWAYRRLSGRGGMGLCPLSAAFPRASGSVPPRTCPQVCKWGIESGLTSGMSQSLKFQAVVVEPVLAGSHQPCSEHPGSVKPLSHRRSARHGCVTVILKIKMTPSFKIRLVLMC